ncbi:MAG: S1 RNA-binding domain-containing protein [Myxococcales bacterium]|nr:S1 RNA-binding domain-containing protein [Myxococcales bacterium]MCB9542704.1 S1 RNA-binding domain-containing protein [Myxococcales bacterium]MCB9552844.1 S1 RNA-binding domain-containing protein [Myxococcales bacterium]
MQIETARIADEIVTFETGRIARRAAGAVVLRHRETFILATIATGPARPDEDFLPLTVDYRERRSAVGRIPSNFFRRETRPEPDEILTSRLIDRALRPLFAPGWRATVQIDVTVHGADPASDLPGLALTAAAAAAHVSGLPFAGPVAGLRVLSRGGALVPFAAVTDTAPAELELMVAGGRRGPVMIEGEAAAAPTDAVVAAIEAALGALSPLLDAIERLGASAGRERMAWPAAPKPDPARAALLAGERADGRAPEAVRPITIETGLIAAAHGSVLFTRGETQALVTATLGGAREGQDTEGLFGSQRERCLLHYNFPGFAVGEARAVRGPGRRELGHGRLARRALAAVLPDEAAWPYVARVVSDITESNGSSSMATVCGAALALIAAGVPLRAPVAGIAMGLVREGEQAVILTDLSGDEDHVGDMDLKVAGTADGITAIQLDTKPGELPLSVIAAALDQAATARRVILDAMETAIAGLVEPPRFAPRHAVLRIEAGRVGQVIGSGGRNLAAVQARTGTRIDVSRDGVTLILGGTPEGVAEARAAIEGVAVELVKGGLYRARVRAVRDYGLLVRIGDHDGLVHVSEWGEGDHKARGEGDELVVRVLGADKRGRLVLSHKAAAGAAEDEVRG